MKWFKRLGLVTAAAALGGGLALTAPSQATTPQQTALTATSPDDCNRPYRVTPASCVCC